MLTCVVETLAQGTGDDRAADWSAPRTSHRRLRPVARTRRAGEKVTWAVFASDLQCDLCSP